MRSRSISPKKSASRRIANEQGSSGSDVIRGKRDDPAFARTEMDTLEAFQDGIGSIVHIDIKLYDFVPFALGCIGYAGRCRVTVNGLIRICKGRVTQSVAEWEKRLTR